jgi:hypothetical protein
VKRVGYLAGAVLLLLAAATLVAQLLSVLAHHGYAPIGLSTIWYQVHAPSLQGLQAVVEKDLSPAIWPPVAWVLGLPAWLVLGVLGGVLFFACRGGAGRGGRGFE